jgi:hypothetical protein
MRNFGTVIQVRKPLAFIKSAEKSCPLSNTASTPGDNDVLFGVPIRTAGHQEYWNSQASNLEGSRIQNQTWQAVPFPRQSNPGST